MRQHGGGDAAEQMSHEPAAAVGAEHDEARLRARRRRRRSPSTSALPRSPRSAAGTPPASASDAPCAAVSSAALPHLAGVLGRVELPLAGGHESDVARLPDADDQRVAPGRKLAAGLLDRELRELRAVVGEAAPARRRRGRSAPASLGAIVSWHSRSRGGRRQARSNSASSGGEYQAGPSPSTKPSMSGACGRAPPSA